MFVLSDLDIGMNDWMVPKLTWDDTYRPDRGKVLSAEELEEAKGFSRYLDVDGDGITYRTLPGVHPKGAYFTAAPATTGMARIRKTATSMSTCWIASTGRSSARRASLPAPVMRTTPGAGSGS